MPSKRRSLSGGGDLTEIHSAKTLFNPSVAQISAIAVHGASERVAVARYTDEAKGSKRKVASWLEFFHFYHTEATAHLAPRQRLVGSGSVVESLAWLGSGFGVVGVGSDGAATLFREDRPLRSCRLQVSPSALWCVSASPDTETLVCCSEDGSLYFLGREDDALVVEKTFLGVSEARILSAAWLDAERIAVGTMGAVLLLKPHTNRPYLTLRLGPQNVAVWALALSPLDPSVLISGDSQGCVSFWNTGSGTAVGQVKTAPTGDVLALAAWTTAQGGGLVAAAGVDPRIQLLAANKTKSGWAPGPVRRLHSHDVRAMILLGDDWLLSGGVDSALRLSRFPPKLEEAAPTFWPGDGRVVVAANRLLVVEPSGLVLWRLGTVDHASPSKAPRLEGEKLPLAEGPKELLRMRLKRPLLAAAISPDGTLLLLSDAVESRLFRFEGEEEGLERLPSGDPSELPSASVVSLGPDGAGVLCLDSLLILVGLGEDGVRRRARLQLPEELGAMRRLRWRADGGALACLTVGGAVVVVDMEAFEVESTTPGREDGGTAQDVCFLGDQVLVLGQDKEGSHLRKAGETPVWSGAERLGSVEASPDGQRVMLAGPGGLVTLRPGEKAVPRRLPCSSLSFGGWLGPSAAVTVSLDAEAAAARLPPAVVTSNFGRK